MVADQVLMRGGAFAIVKHRLLRDLNRDHSEAAGRISCRLRAVEMGDFAVKPPRSGPVIEGLGLYARLLRDLLKELGYEQPDWRRVLQIQRWIELLERGPGVKHERASQ